jgi:hypothetical protein
VGRVRLRREGAGEGKAFGSRQKYNRAAGPAARRGIPLHGREWRLPPSGPLGGAVGAEDCSASELAGIISVQPPIRRPKPAIGRRLYAGIWFSCYINGKLI